MFDGNMLESKFINGYHITKGDSAAISIAYGGFDLDVSNRGCLYGKGFYMGRNLSEHIKKIGYGKNIIHSHVDMKDVLILDLALAVKVFNYPKTMLEQFEERLIKTNRELPIKIMQLLQEHSKRCSNLLSHYYTSETAKFVANNYNPVLKDLFSGIAYTGRNDGSCLVIYNVNQVYPHAHAQIPSSETIDEEEDSTRILEKIVWYKYNKKEIIRVRKGRMSRIHRLLKMLETLPFNRAIIKFKMLATKIKIEDADYVLSSLESYVRKQNTTAKLSNVKTLNRQKTLDFLNKLIVSLPCNFFDIFIKEILEKNNFLNDKFTHHVFKTNITLLNTRLNEDLDKIASNAMIKYIDNFATTLTNCTDSDRFEACKKFYNYWNRNNNELLKWPTLKEIFLANLPKLFLVPRILNNVNIFGFIVAVINMFITPIKLKFDKQNDATDSDYELTKEELRKLIKLPLNNAFSYEKQKSNTDKDGKTKTKK